MAIMDTEIQNLKTAESKQEAAVKRTGYFKIILQGISFPEGTAKMVDR
jgi:hypothetical protein